MPYLKTHENLRVLDFGCGEGHYIHYVKEHKLAACAVGVEFYNNNQKLINVALGNFQINVLKKSIETGGLFDVVVLDSVINSVDSLEAEKAVLVACNTFLKPNGLLFLSGRPIEGQAFVKNSTRFSSNNRTYIYMFDENGFTANFRKGNWFYQKFHSKDEIERKLLDTGFSDISYSNSSITSFQVTCKKINSLSLDAMKSAIDFEFNLPLPNGKRYNRHEEMWQVISNEYRNEKKSMT